MIFHNTRMLLACAALSVSFATAATADDCKLVRIASLDFQIGDNGMIVVPVSIEGETVPMAVDTESTVSVIDKSLVDRLHLPNQDIVQGILFDTSGERYTQTARIHQFAIGTMHGANIDMAISPSSLSADKISGLLGNDMLRQSDLDLDFGAGKLNLFSKDHCDGKVVYWQADAVTVVPVHIVPTGQIMVPVTLDGHAFNALLDTGSANTHLSLEAAQNVFRLVPDSAGMIRVGSFGPGGRTPVYQHVFGSLDLQGIAFRHPAIRIYEDLERMSIEGTPDTGSRLGRADELQNISDLGLGVNDLRKLHIYIAYKEQKLYVSAAAAPQVAATSSAAGSAPASAPATAATH